MGHHFFTNSDADAKRGLYKITINYPAHLRFIANTVMKFGQFLTGMTFRWISIFFEDNMASYNWAKHVGFVFVRTIMVSEFFFAWYIGCLLYTSPSPRDQRGSRMPSSA